MRMWMVDPRLMCDRHLLGEHVEIHMLAGCLRKKRSIRGYIEKGLVEARSIRARHRALVREMRRRHMNHASPLPRRIPFAEKGGPSGRVDRKASLKELRGRCARCQQMQNGEFVGEQIRPDAGTFNTLALIGGEPAMPGKFTWRDEAFEVAEVLERWKETGPAKERGGGLYLRKHWFRIRTTSGDEMTLYFERTARSARQRKARWWLYTRKHG